VGNRNKFEAFATTCSNILIVIKSPYSGLKVYKIEKESYPKSLTIKKAQGDKMKYKKSITIAIFLLIIIANLFIYNYNKEKSVNKSIRISNEEELIEIHVDALSNDDLQKYYGKEVEIFLKSINEKYLSYNFMDEPPGKINGCLFTYDKRQIYIYINTKERELYRIFKIPDKSNWKIEKFLKLKVEKIEIFELDKKKQ